MKIYILWKSCQMPSLGLHLCTLFLLAWEPHLGSVLARAYVIHMLCCALFLANPKLALLTWLPGLACLVSEDLPSNHQVLSWPQSLSPVQRCSPTGVPWDCSPQWVPLLTLVSPTFKGSPVSLLPGRQYPKILLQGFLKELKLPTCNVYE